MNDPPPPPDNTSQRKGVIELAPISTFDVEDLALCRRAMVTASGLERQRRTV